MIRRKLNTPLILLSAALFILVSSSQLAGMAQTAPPKPTPEVRALLDPAQKAVESRDFPAAATLYAQALARARELKDRTGEADGLRGLGAVYSSTGQLQKALELFQQALSLYQAVGDRDGEARTLDTMGVVYDKTGQPQRALLFYEQEAALYRALGDSAGVEKVERKLYSLYQRRTAMENYRKALLITRSVGNKENEANALSKVWPTLAEPGQSQKALESFQQDLARQKAIRNPGGQAAALGNIGVVYYNTSRPQKALEFHLKALPLYRAAADKSGEAGALINIGNVYAITGQPRKAREFYLRALPIYRAIGHIGMEVTTLTGLALVEGRLNRHAAAEAHYAQAVALLETFRGNLGGFSEAKSAFLESMLGTYYAYLNVLLERGSTVKAFEVAQKTKARSLLDLMVSGRVTLNAELTPDERKQEQTLLQKASVLNQQMVKEGVENEVGAKKRYAALKRDLKEVESQLQTLTDTLYVRHPSLAQKRAARTATIGDIARFLPADTALLDYIVLSRAKLALFVVTRHKSGATVRSLTLPVAYQSLVKKAAAFRGGCADPRKDYRRAAAELYKTLIVPAEKQLAGKKRLVICPDGALWDVPFQALLSKNQFLAQRYEIAYAYSATGAQATRTANANRKKPTGTLLALANPDFGSSKRFGDLDDLPGQRPFDTPSRPFDQPSRPFDQPSRPFDQPSRPVDIPSRTFDTVSRTFDTISRGGRIVSLPGTQREADALKRDFRDARVLTGPEAQESVAKRDAGKYRYLHFATHGFFNDASPLLSSIVLAQPEKDSKEDGFLTAREIFDMDLSAEMVVLSACNTARGAQRSGDGVIGLTWALFVAGCPTQVVSQWAVDDASTATLMESFYANLTKKNMTKGTALRQASLSLMKDRKHRHPYYWAPFVLMGDWR